MSIERKGALTNVPMLPFERNGYGVNVPGAWLRLYTTVPGYCREFGWRAVFLGGCCE